MYRFQELKNSWVPLVIFTLMGVVVTIGNPFAVDAKETISKRALKEMVAGAKTSDDHKAIANYYYAEAAKAHAKAQEHEQMADWYRTVGEANKKIPFAPGTIEHCKHLAKSYTATADDLTALAKGHEAMATKAK